MTMGEKIRRVRQSKGLTQKQVAGDRITRNMLSKIENNSATPSLKTLEYIAAKLGMPANYFLGEVGSPIDNLPGVTNARNACRRGEFKKTLELLEGTDSSESDRADEISALRALACAGIAREHYRAGRFNSARAYAREALKHNQACLYYNGDLTVECSQLVILCAVRSENPATVADGREAARVLFEEERRGGLTERNELIERFWFAERLERLEHPAHDEPSDAWSRAMRHYLNGREAANEGKGREAMEELLVAVDAARDDGGKSLLNDIYAALEDASREQGDYRAAYEYAAKRLMLEKRESDREGAVDEEV